MPGSAVVGIKDEVERGNTSIVTQMASNAIVILSEY
jgi:hypothetical protein